MTIIWGMHHIWQGYTTPHTTISPPTTPQTCSAVTLDIRTKSMDLISGVRIMTHVWICCPIVLWVYYMRYRPHLMGVDQPTNHSMTSNYTSGSPHRQQYQLQLYPIDAQLLPWFPESLNHEPHHWCSGPMMMMQVWICDPTVYMCYMSMMHWPCVTWVDHPTADSMTSNHTQNMLRLLLLWFSHPRAWTMT